ncbi:hypothetical protein [Nocardioides sp. LHG3406-4]
MSPTRRILVGVVATLSLLGIGGAVTAATPDAPTTVSANRWCC